MPYVEVLVLEDGVVKSVAQIWENGLIVGNRRWRETIKVRWNTSGIPRRGPKLLAWALREFDRGAVATTIGEGAPPPQGKSCSRFWGLE